MIQMFQTLLRSPRPAGTTAGLIRRSRRTGARPERQVHRAPADQARDQRDRAERAPPAAERHSRGESRDPDDDPKSSIDTTDVAVHDGLFLRCSRLGSRPGSRGERVRDPTSATIRTTLRLNRDHGHRTRVSVGIVGKGQVRARHAPGARLRRTRRCVGDRARALQRREHAADRFTRAASSGILRYRVDLRPLLTAIDLVLGDVADGQQSPQHDQCTGSRSPSRPAQGSAGWELWSTVVYGTSDGCPKSQTSRLSEPRPETLSEPRAPRSGVSSCSARRIAFGN